MNFIFKLQKVTICIKYSKMYSKQPELAVCFDLRESNLGLAIPDLN